MAGAAVALLVPVLRGAEPTPLALPALPYAPDALEPHLSARTLEFHYTRHHQGYLDNLNRQVAGTPLAGQSLDAIIAAVAGKPEQQGLFNNSQNRRKAFVQVFLDHLVNWDFVAGRLP